MPSSKTVNLLFDETANTTQTKFNPNDSNYQTATDHLYNSKKSHYLNAIKEKSNIARKTELYGFIKSKPLSVFNFHGKLLFEDINLIKRKNNIQCHRHSREKIKS